MGTKKGQVRKTARRAYEPKKKEYWSQKYSSRNVAELNLFNQIKRFNFKQVEENRSFRSNKGLFGIEKVGNWWRIFKK